MKSPTHLTIATMFAGALWTVASVIRYYVFWQDIDRLLSYTLIGILIMAVAYLYEYKVRYDRRLLALEDYLSDKKGRKK